MKKLVKDNELDCVMSNCDYNIDKEIAEELKNNPGSYAQYAGWNFCGYVAYEEGIWYCEVWVYGNHEETVEADSLEEIANIVCNTYGWD